MELEDVVALWDIVRRLDKRHRAIVVLHFRGNLEIPEIAQVLNIAPDRVESWLNEALAIIRREWEG